jgi:hypothetical protein
VASLRVENEANTQAKVCQSVRELSTVAVQGRLDVGSDNGSMCVRMAVEMRTCCWLRTSIHSTRSTWLSRQYAMGRLSRRASFILVVRKCSHAPSAPLAPGCERAL